MNTKLNEHIKELLKQTKKLGIDGTLVLKLRRDAITLRRLYEYECNGCSREKFPHESWDDYCKHREEIQRPWIEKRIATVEKRIAKRCEGIPYYIQSDPRGCSLYLGTTSESKYSTEGVAIY